MDKPENFFIGLANGTLLGALLWIGAWWLLK